MGNNTSTRAATTPSKARRMGERVAKAPPLTHVRRPGLIRHRMWHKRAVPPSSPRLSFLRSRLGGRLGRAAAVLVLVTVVVVIIPPFRRAAAFGASRMILFIASPIAPDIKGFDRL